MEQIDIKELKNWIAPYLTVNGTHPQISAELREQNIIEYFKQLTIPNVFESYAIILHSFWIYDTTADRIKENNLKGINIESYNNDFPEEEYRAVKWAEFYNYRNMAFNLAAAIKENVEWNRSFKQMNNEIWPGEGLIDIDILNTVSQIIIRMFGEQIIDAYYIFMATINYDNDEMYRGKLSELISFLKSYNSRLTPSLIYEIESKWAIASDFDLPFSIIGGNNALIRELVKTHKDQIYIIE